MLTRLQIIVINYKTPDMTIKCVETLLEDMDCGCDKVVIVDNHSNDGSLENIRRWIVKNNMIGIVYLNSSYVNGGFSYGCNLGAGSLKSEYLMFVNSDALVMTGAIKSMLSAVRARKNIGLVSPLIVNEHDLTEVSRFFNKTPLTEFLRSAETGLFTNLFNYLGVYEVAQYKDNINVAPEWVSFACILLRRDAYNEAGPLDEGFFMYSEDNDYCRRLKLSGWDIAITNEARIVHLNKGLSSSQNKRMPSFFYASRTRYFMKYYGYSGLLFANSLFTLGLVIRWSRYLVGKGVPYKYKYALFDIWTNFFHPMKNSM